MTAFFAAAGLPALIAIALLGGCIKKSTDRGPTGEEKVLNVYSWSTYIAPDTIDNFQKETGIKIRYDLYESNEVLEAKLLTGHTNYDIVIPSGDFLERQVKAGVFHRLERNLLTNAANLDPPRCAPGSAGISATAGPCCSIRTTRPG